MKTGTMRRRANRARREREKQVRSMTQGEVTDTQLSVHPGHASARFYEFHRDQMLQRPDTPVRLICSFPEAGLSPPEPDLSGVPWWERQTILSRPRPAPLADDDQTCETAVKHGFRMQGIVVSTTVLKTRRRGGRRAITFLVRFDKTIPARF
ncbi:MAG: hypothetical protein V1907_01705 [Candidatus Kerfeldbacteria bacterium]